MNHARRGAEGPHKQEPPAPIEPQEDEMRQYAVEWKRRATQAEARLEELEQVVKEVESALSDLLLDIAAGGPWGMTSDPELGIEAASKRLRSALTPKDTEEG